MPMPEIQAAPLKSSRASWPLRRTKGLGLREPVAVEAPCLPATVEDESIAIEAEGRTLF